MKSVPVKYLVPVFAVLALAACSEEKQAETVPEPTAQQIRMAEDMSPADPALAEKYDRACRSCHALPDSGAPLTGFAPQWQPRIAERGVEGLLASTKAGFNNMPARGLCADCSDDDFRGLIAFMNGQEGGAQ